ncbi:hypothetical protein L484_008335 [Morus notabilis]|uniref:Uncharacterized protein n=1 Tax=Morus notabilis TaxID=981085 RepID=W9SP80_9ROSA|nr:hypothetical protein L484_008335 [Morus notabilis]
MPARETYTPPPSSNISTTLASKGLSLPRKVKPLIHSLFRHHTHAAMSCLTFNPSPTIAYPHIIITLVFASLVSSSSLHAAEITLYVGFQNVFECGSVVM